MKNQLIHKNSDIKILEIAPFTIADKLWYCVGFEPANENMGDNFHLALIHDRNIVPNPVNIWKQLTNCFLTKPILLRIHSECILGDSFGSNQCDCRQQLSNAIRIISKQGSGIIIYMRQEGRGIGLRAKLSCLALQEGYVSGTKSQRKHTPDEANLALGHSVDERDYTIATQFLEIFESKKVKILTGNPKKIQSLKVAGFDVLVANKTKKNKKLTARQMIEISEKISRGYTYPDLEIVLNK